MSSLAADVLVFKPRPKPEQAVLAQINDLAFNLKFHQRAARRSLGEAREIRKMSDEVMGQAILLSQALTQAWRERDSGLSAEIINALPERLMRLRALSTAERSCWEKDAGESIKEIESSILGIIGLTDPRGSRPAA